MRIALRLPTSGPDELIDAQRRFHLAAGADIAEAGFDGEADWTLEVEEGEFLWPHGGSLKNVLGSIEAPYGAVCALVRHLVASEADGPLVERAIYRLAPQAPGRGSGPERKLLPRAGGHGRAPRGWYPVEALRLATRASPLSSGQIDRALAEGALVLDTRLRDALRAAASGEPLTFPRPSVAEDAGLALDVAVRGEADVLAAHERLDELEGRLAMVESSLPARLERRLRALVHRRR